MSDLLLIDLPSLVYPLWHVSSREPDPDWTSTQALSRARSMAARHKHVAICGDAGASFRKALDPNYKGNRPEREAPLLHQLQVTIDRLKEDGYQFWAAKGFEADDVIATATREAFERGMSVTIASADKDLLQLVSDDAGVCVHHAMTGDLYDEAKVYAKHAVTPAQMRDYLSLVGDASDNVKGVRGIGAKTAADILTRFGTLDSLIERMQAGESAGTLGLKPSTYQALIESSAVMALARELITLRADAPIDFDTVLQPVTPQHAEPHEDTMQTLIDQMDAGQEADTKNEAPAPEPTTQPEPGKPEAKPATTALVTVEPFAGAWERQLEPRSARDTMIISKSLYESRLFSSYGNPNAVAAIIFAGRELGLGMMASLRGFHTIEGKPSMAADLMRSLVLSSGKAEFFVCKQRTPKESTWITRRKGDPCDVELSYSMEEAVTAGLVRGGSGWTKHPADMVAKTASSKLCRLVYPDVTFGLYSAEELGGGDE